MRLTFSIDVTGRKLLLLALVVGAALRVPGWFTQEIMARWRLFETDEEQHLSIAMKRYNELNLAAGFADTIPHEFHDRSVNYYKRDFNVQGYALTNAHLLHGWYRLSGQNPNFGATLRLGRQLATLYSLVLILLVYLIGREGGLSPPWAGVAACLLAACDLNASYSHYALPLTGYQMFFYLSVLGTLRLIRRPASVASVLMLAVGAAGSVAYKFDVLPMGFGGLVLLLLCWRFYQTPSTSARARVPFGYVALGTAVLVATFFLLTAGWSWEEIRYSFVALREGNQNIVEVENHLRDNLIVYPLIVLAGLGLPAFGFACWGLYRVLWGRGRRMGGGGANFWTVGQLGVYYALALIGTEFVLLWSLDSAFVRRASIFMPAVVLLATYGLRTVRARPWLVSSVFLWSLGLALVGQSNHWFDTRYAFRDWANKELRKPLRVGISGYLHADGLENWRYFASADFDYFALHESWYKRYLPNIATPFGLPECCPGVYHCPGPGLCEEIQGLLTGQRDDFELVKRFDALDVFPERLLYHALFGYYEDFMGDVVVYKRIKPKRGERSTS